MFIFFLKSSPLCAAISLSLLLWILLYCSTPFSSSRTHPKALNRRSLIRSIRVWSLFVHPSSQETSSIMVKDYSGCRFTRVTLECETSVADIFKALGSFLAKQWILDQFSSNLSRHSQQPHWAALSTSQSAVGPHRLNRWQVQNLNLQIIVASLSC